MTTHPHRPRRVALGAMTMLSCSLLSCSLLAAVTSPAVASVSTAAAPALREKTGPLSPYLQEVVAAGNVRPQRAPSAAGGARVDGPGTPLIRPGGTVTVDVRVAATDEATLARVRATGAEVLFVDAALRMLTLGVGPSAAAALAQVPGVISVVEVPTPALNATCPTGVPSEGDVQLHADTTRTTQSIDGTGVMVGILSDSYDNLSGASADVAAGELPGTANPCTHLDPVTVQAEHSLVGPGRDEGRAMAQVVHDVAPGATLRFATGFNGESDFAQQIRNLATAGAKVIVDDVTYFSEPMYQDGVISQAVEDVTADGVTYFSAAGNATTFVNGHNVSSYEAMAYRPAACPATVVNLALDCHDFDAGPGVDTTYGLTLAGELTYVLGWNEPQFGVGTDFDVFLLNHANGAVVAQAAVDNLDLQKAYELLTYTGTGQYDLVLGRYEGTAAPRFRFVSWGSKLTAMERETASGSDVVGPAAFGHNVGRASFSVAAVPYDNANTIETFSSRGPATWCWAGVTGAFPAASLGACQTASIDVAATDGTGNSFFGSAVSGTFRFYGTSAAAPHAAAIAALIRQKAPCFTPGDIYDVMTTTAVPIAGLTSNDQGSGRLDASAALGVAVCGTTPSASGLVTLGAPARIMDTRPGFSTSDGQFAGLGLRTAGSVTPLTVHSRGGVPGGVPAVVLNIAVTQPSSSGWVTAYPCGQSVPATSTLNFEAGQTIANSVTMKVGTGGQVCLYASTSTHVIVDVTAYHPDTSMFTGLSAPQRLLDTRPGFTTSDGQQQGVGSLPGNGTFEVTARNRVGIPAGASAVDLNLTVTSPSGGGWVTVSPCGQLPNASAINFAAGQTIANHVVAKVGPNDTVCLTPSVGTHAIVDVTGYYSANLVSLAAPARLADTRPLSTVDGRYAGQGALSASQFRTIQISGRAGIPSNATAAVLNVTVTSPVAGGWVVVYPCGQTLPPSSNLNYAAGQTIASTVITRLGGSGQICLSSPTSTQVIVDASAYAI